MVRAKVKKIFFEVDGGGKARWRKPSSDLSLLIQPAGRQLSLALSGRSPSCSYFTPMQKRQRTKNEVGSGSFSRKQISGSAAMPPMTAGKRHPFMGKTLAWLTPAPPLPQIPAHMMTILGGGLGRPWHVQQIWFQKTKN